MVLFGSVYLEREQVVVDSAAKSPIWIVGWEKMLLLERSQNSIFAQIHKSQITNTQNLCICVTVS